MKLKKASLIFILTLFIVLIYTVGVRQGQQVEKTNKIVNYLISLPPSPTIQPSQIPLEFKLFTNKYCGIEFLIPSGIIIDKETSASASMSNRSLLARPQNMNREISISCEKNNDIYKVLNRDKVATAEISFLEKKIIAKSVHENSQDQLYFNYLNPINSKMLYFKISKSLLKFFERDLNFINK